MKANVIVALLLGLVLGFAVGKIFQTPSAAPAVAAGGGTTDQSGFQWKSGDLPAEYFTGLSDAQKYTVMKVMNENTCDCGCDKGTLANCVKTDPNCPNSPAKLRQVVTLAKGGKSAEQIQQEMFGKPAPRPTQVAQAPQQPSRREIAQTVFKVPVDGSPTQGRADALITLVEFSDYQCPFCTRANATVKQVQATYGDKVRVVMKQLPLDFHDRAKPAALAALAAGQQGKYWEMHEKLFENAKALDDASLTSYAKSIGLDLARFERDRKDTKLQAQMEADIKLASSLGVNGTPGFFINGRKVSGAVPFDTFKQVIDEELPKAEALVKAGTPASEVYAKIQATAVAAPAPAAAQPQAAQYAKVDAPAESPSYGPKNAKVTIVEWSDFQCPFCSRALPTLAQIKETYPKDVRVVFRHQPLSFHAQAQISAEASMAAHEQGKFWEMHDKLFQNQKALDRASLEGYAKELGLDMNKFKAALDSGKFRQQIAKDSQTGMAVGAGGTPTFFINGRKLVGAQPFQSFKPIIDEELAKAEKLLASGVKPEKLYEKVLEQNTGSPAQAQNAP